jgi:outer membrane lipoprotein carrier protein
MKKWLLWGLIFSNFNSFALGLTLEESIQNIQAKENEITSIQFDFSQEIKFLGLDSSSMVHGSAIFKKPQQMRIIKKEPVEQITISNGKKMWVYTPTYKQVWEGNWRGWVNAAVVPKGMVPLGNFVQDLKKNFNLKLLESVDNEAKTLTLRAIPKDANSGYTIDLLVSTENWMPVSTIFLSETARIVTTLQNIVLNAPVNDENFIFKAPKGTEVIKLN